MTWSTFYLVCFVVGFTLSALSLLSGLGHLHLPVKWHLHFGHGGGLGAGAHSAGIGATQASAGGAAHAGGGRAGLASGGISPFNFFTLMAFLTWFGGTGYLLTQYSSLWFALGLLIASASGLVGAGAIFLFLTRVILAHEANLEPESMIGVLGRLSVSIRQGGTGEIVYSQGGTRHTCAACAEEGTAICRGAEVVVTRYENGIAYVRRWEEMAHE